jgi:ribonuclease R
VDAQQIQTMLLRSMQQAVYTSANAGHFGLAYEAYTHFTSPIRRYPDLLVHRVIKALLAERRYHLVPSAKTRVPEPRRGAPQRAKSTKPVPPEVAAWDAVGAHCSANERRADEASKDVEAWLKCRYMRERLGEEFSGTVSAATSFGLFVTLDSLYVEGLVHITELGGEYYKFDEARQELRGERTGVRYAIGVRVRVQVSRVDLDGRRIDFRLVREGEGERSAARGKAERADRADQAARAARAAVADGSAAQVGSAAEELAALRLADRALKAVARERKAASSKASNANKVARKAGARKPAAKARGRR